MYIISVCVLFQHILNCIFMKLKQWYSTAFIGAIPQDTSQYYKHNILVNVYFCMNECRQGVTNVALPAHTRWNKIVPGYLDLDFVNTLLVAKHIMSSTD